MLTSANTNLLSSSLLGDKKSTGRSRLVFDLAAFLIIIAAISIISLEQQDIVGSITILQTHPIDLNYHNLFEYAMRTVLRMFVAAFFAVLFSIIYGVIAAKCHRLEKILIPFLDILQSIPVLGYISFTIVGFLALFPGQIIGAEAAVIFAIFTSQAWNITFSAYQSFKTVPVELEEAAKIFRMSKWEKFWRAELPFAIPGIIWNLVVSMSGGWFFVVASEVIVVGNNNIILPGLGSYISLALHSQNVTAIIYAVMAMVIVILLYDQFILRPLVTWSAKFRYDMATSAEATPSSWVFVIFKRSKLIAWLCSPLKIILKKIIYIKWPINYSQSGLLTPNRASTVNSQKLMDYLWYFMLVFGAILAARFLINFMHTEIGLSEIAYVFFLATLTLLRVIILVALASLIWVPIGIYVGLNSRLTAFIQPLVQFLASFPVNILFPFAVLGIMHFNLNADIWVSPLMIMGTQWYILFNVIAGSNAIPVDLREATINLRIKGWLWWKKIMLPAVTPHYITGAITACGGAWNASIITEVISFGDKQIVAKGLGSYIAEMTVKGDNPKIALGIAMMALFVVMLNRLFWQPIYDKAKQKFQI